MVHGTDDADFHFALLHWRQLVYDWSMLATLFVADDVIAHVPAIGIAGIWRRGAGLTAESRADSSCE
jgi:hypothetical protein